MSSAAAAAAAAAIPGSSIPGVNLNDMVTEQKGSSSGEKDIYRCNCHNFLGATMDAFIYFLFRKFINHGVSRCVNYLATQKLYDFFDNLVNEAFDPNDEHESLTHAFYVIGSKRGPDVLAGIWKSVLLRFYTELFPSMKNSKEVQKDIYRLFAFEELDKVFLWNLVYFLDKSDKPENVTNRQYSNFIRDFENFLSYEKEAFIPMKRCLKCIKAQ